MHLLILFHIDNIAFVDKNVFLLYIRMYIRYVYKIPYQQNSLYNIIIINYQQKYFFLTDNYTTVYISLFHYLIETKQFKWKHISSVTIVRVIKVKYHIANIFYESVSRIRIKNVTLYRSKVFSYLFYKHELFCFASSNKRPPLSDSRS